MQYILEAKNIHKHYSNHTALNDVSISLERGSIFGLLGPNGAGKTSLIRIITQITEADAGEVTFKGDLLAREHISQMGYLPEERGLYKKMRVAEQLLYLARLKGMDKKEAQRKINHWLDKFSIRDWSKKNIEELSKGMQQKVQFIATVLHEPDLIILDEPFSGFDPVNANLIKDEILQLREKGSTIIFSTHRMESVEELCDDIALIHQARKVLSGKKQEIKETYRTNTYWATTSQVITALPDSFELLSSKQEGNQHISKIKIKEGSTNQLLMALMQEGNSVEGLREDLPSMNDIFISVVGKPAEEIELV